MDVPLDLSKIEIKIEPDEPTYENENDDVFESEVDENFIGIKQEPTDLSVNVETKEIKDNYDKDNKDNNASPINTRMKLEPPCYDDCDAGSLLTISVKRNHAKSDDDEYIPSRTKKKKKKKELNVKPLFKGKTRTDGEKYSDDITKHIEIVTISEAERALEHHNILSTRKHMNHICEPCALGFVIEDAYNMHMKMHAPENGDHKCDICFVRMKTADILYRHKLRHYRRYRCCICLLQLRDKDTVAAHVMKVHMGTAFICTHCGRDFRRPQYLKRHVEQMHTKPLHLECPVCHRVFYERGWYRCHVRTHNEEVRKNVDRKAICSHCGREFRNKSYLVRHLQTHEDRRPVKCRDCSRMFKNNEVLRVHVRQHHKASVVNEDGSYVENFSSRVYPSQERVSGPGANTTCDQCGRVLTTRAMLARHTQRMHGERERKFQCDYCKRWYFTKGEVRSHIEWSHLRRRRHACTCGRVFRTPARLRAHAAAAHLQITPPRDKTCPVCGKMFANQQVLTRHVKSHSGETYPCEECGQSFKTQSYVKVHYKLKHLNMTREQIKAQTKRELIMVDNHAHETMNAKIKFSKKKIDPLNIEDGNVDIKQEPSDLAVPLFETFVDIQRHF